jgi:hypothetical protein
MYKKLMFLISLVFLLGLSTSARAYELEVDQGETLVISSLVEVADFRIEGTLIVTATGHLIADGSDDRSDIDGGDGDAGAGLVQVDGGIVNVHSRLNIGTDHKGYIVINDGGLFTQEGFGNDWADGLKFPDNSGGEHRIVINDGTLHTYTIEQKATRDAKVELGCAGTLIMDYTKSSQDYCPTDWQSNNDLYCINNCSGPVFLGSCGDPMQVYCFKEPNEAYDPCPDDGVSAVPVDIVLTWHEGATMGGHPGDKHYVFFSTSEDDVTNDIIGGDSYQGFKPVGLEEFDPAGDLDLWVTYFWRIDEKPFGAPTFKGNIWSFTAGCEMVPGDINLDCFVDGTDFAMLADDWMVESFFPEDF